jgi:hypothetical protein
MAGNTNHHRIIINKKPLSPYGLELFFGTYIHPDTIMSSYERWDRLRDDIFPRLYEEGDKEAFYNKFGWWKPMMQIDHRAPLKDKVKVGVYLCQALHERFICDPTTEKNIAMAKAYIRELHPLVNEYLNDGDLNNSQDRQELGSRLMEKIREVTESIQDIENGGGSTNNSLSLNVNQRM